MFFFIYNTFTKNKKEQKILTKVIFLFPIKQNQLKRTKPR